MPISTADYQAILARLNKNQIREVPEAVDDESDLQEQCINEVKRRGWFVVHSRMDLPTTTPLGTPDLIVFADNGVTYLFELKSKSGKLRPKQLGVKMMLEKLGHEVHVIYNFQSFFDAIKNPRLTESGG